MKKESSLQNVHYITKTEYQNNETEDNKSREHTGEETNFAISGFQLKIIVPIHYILEEN